MKWPRLNIYRKTLTILLLVGLIPAALAVFLTARELWSVAVDVAGDDIATQAKNIAILLDNKLRTFLAHGTAATTDQPEFVRLFFVQEAEPATGALPALAPPAPVWEPPPPTTQSLAALFPPAGQQAPSTQTAFIIYRSGQVCPYALSPDRRSLQPLDPQPYRYLAARAESTPQGMFAVSVHTDPLLRRPAALVWLPIPPRNPEHALGWIAVEMPVEQLLRDEALRALVGEDEAFLVTYSGHILDKISIAPHQIDEIRPRLLKSSESAVEGFVEIKLQDGAWRLVGFSPIPLTRGLRPMRRTDSVWFLCVARDLQPLANDFQSHLIQDVMAGIVLAVLLCGFAYFVARRLVRPILRLEEGVRLIADGEFGSRVEIATGDELERLANAFNDMADRLQQAALDIQQQMSTVRRQADELTLVHEVSRAINARLDLDQTLATFARETAAVIDHDHLSVALLDEDGRHFTVQTAFPPAGASEFAPGTRHHLEESDIGQAIRDGRPIVKRDIGRSPQRALDDHLASIGFRSLMVVPLLSESRAIGSVVLASRRPDAFGPEDQKRMSFLAESVAVAIQHSRLYMRVRRFAEEQEDEVRRRTAQLRRAQDKLIQTEKLAASGQLAAGIAHEINNPLGIIKNYLRLTMDRLRQGPEDKAALAALPHLSVIEEEISRIARIVRNLLDIYHPREHSPEPIDVKDLLERVLELFTHNWSKQGIAVERRYAGILPVVVVSTDRLRQVFINLLRNAEDAMPEGGKVSLTTRLAPASAESEHDHVVVEVEDTGSGIPKEDQGRVFDPFFTTKKGGSGTGLGLSITYGIIRSWGGSIDVESAPGVGTRISITIPVPRTAGVSEAPRPGQTKAATVSPAPQASINNSRADEA